MNPDDLIQEGLIGETDLDGGPPEVEAAELGPFGRYTLLAELGRGGSGIVYRAADPVLNREVALKRLRYADGELEARFLREAELLARLTHPGIMPVFDFGRVGESLYFTMPVASGLSLDQWIAERRPDARESARVVKQAAEALAHAHERGVIHRDVKPHNIMVTGSGDALLADFGLGRATDPGEANRVTLSGEVMGTPNYMAPEFAWGDLKRADARCDVYGLGATLYEAITRQPPFAGKSSLEILHRVTVQEPPPPRRLAADVPADLETICLKSMEKDPLRRYATAREMADDLGRFLAGEAIHARRASAMYRLSRFLLRRRALVAVALAGFVIAGSVFVVGRLRERGSKATRLIVSNYMHEARRQNENVNRLLERLSEKDPEVVNAAMLGLDLVNRAIQEEPDNGEAYYLKGVNYALRFEKAEARRNYDAAVERGFTKARLERAVLDLQGLMGTRSQSSKETPAQVSAREAVIEDLEAISRDPSLPEKAFAEGLADICSRDWRSAAGRLEAYAKTTNDWRAHYWQGFSLMESARRLADAADRDECLTRAQAALEKALSMRARCRESAGFLDRLGVVLFQRGQLDESVRRFRSAIELDPAFPDPHYDLANVLLYGFNKPEDAIVEVEAGLTLEPDPAAAPAEAHAIRGLAYARSGDAGSLAKATESLEKALTAFGPGTPQAEFLRKTLESVTKKLDQFRRPGREY